MTATVNTFHFPGEPELWNCVDSTYCDAQLNIGEKIIIEGEPEYFVVTDIQNQFRRVEDNSFGKRFQMIMRNVILERVEE